MSTISKNLKRIRGQKEISQDKLSKLADVSLNTIVKLESGKSPNPTIDTLKSIADALKVSVNDLLN